MAVAETPEEQKIRERFEEDLEVSSDFMRPIHARMDKFYEQYRNRWNENDDHMHESSLYSYVETVVPILTNNRPRAIVKAESPDYQKHAEGMEYILDHVFDKNDWDYIQQRIVRTAEIYRSGLAYTGYDEDKEQLTVTEINPRWCYIDPAVTNLEDSEFFIYVEPMRKTKVKQMYPEKKDEIGKDRDEGDFNSKSKHWFRSLINTVRGYLGVSPQAPFDTLPEMTEEEKRAKSVAFIHYWYRDDNDQWRVAYFADETFLEEHENPFWHEKLPYDLFSPTEDILSAFGIPMAEQIEHISYEKNILLHMFVENAKRAVDPPMIYNSTIGINDPRELTRRAKEDNVIPVANPDYIPLNAIAEYMNVPGIQGWADSLPERFSEIIDRITGVNDSFRGMADATSGKEVQLKQEAAYTRIKTKVDNFEKFVKSIGEKIIINALQFIDSDTEFRVKGDYRRLEPMIEDDNSPFSVERIPTGVNEEGEKEYDTKEFFLYANPNAWTKIAEDIEDGEGKSQVEEAYRILDMIVDIEAGSSLPQSQSAKREEALELYGMEAIDQQALLEIFEFPDYEKILRRMQEKEQAQIEAEQQAQQQAQGGGMMAQMPPIPQGQPMPQQGMAQQPMGQPQQAPQDMQVMIEQIVSNFIQSLSSTNPDLAQRLSQAPPQDVLGVMQEMGMFQQGQPQQPMQGQPQPNNVPPQTPPQG